MKRLFLLVYFGVLSCILVAMAATSWVDVNSYKSDMVPAFVDYSEAISEAIQREHRSSDEPLGSLLAYWLNAPGFGLASLVITDKAVSAPVVEVADITSQYENVVVLVPFKAAELPAQSLRVEFYDEHTASYRLKTLLIRLSIFAVLAVLLWWLSRYCYRYFTQLGERTRQVSGGHFSPDEATVKSPYRLPGFDSLSMDIESMAKQLAERYEAQATFVGAVAHELRSPFTRLRLGLDMASSEKDYGNREVLLAGMDEALTDASSLIDEMLVMARVSLAGKDMSLEAVDIEAVGTLVGQQLSDSRLSFELPELPWVMSTAVIVKHVLLNVIQNALRYANTRVDVNAHVEGGQVVIVVDDDGAGFPDALAGKVFDPFQAGSDSDGWGLGLAFAAQAVRVSGGAISAENNSSGGARIIVRWNAQDKKTNFGDEK